MKIIGVAAVGTLAVLGLVTRWVCKRLDKVEDEFLEAESHEWD